MAKKNKKRVNLGVVIGVLGFLAGIGLMFGDDWITGLFGAIASAGVAYISYKGQQAAKEIEE